jgi:putative ABC transport system permease protein
MVTEDKSKDLKAIVTEKYQLPSQMPFSYAGSLSAEALSLPEGHRPSQADLMTWQFYGGTLDPDKRTPENLIFFFAMEPDKLPTMMDDLENLDPKLVRMLQENRKGTIVGRERLAKMNKKVGEKFKVFSLNYKDIDLEFDIVGTFPEGRYNQSAVMNRDYLNRSLDDYERKNGKPHPMAEKSLNLFWMRLPTTESFELVAERLAQPGKFSSPAVKCETASSGIASWLDAYKDLVWAMRWLLSPAILITMSLVVANAISISVRERMKEMAVLKVLGFRPRQILILVIGEALLIGGISGLASVCLSVGFINGYLGGFKFPIAFFPSFTIPVEWPRPFWQPSAWLHWNPLNNAVVWGLGVGILTSLAGSIVPAWSARKVKVSEVFAKVA